MTDKKIDHTLQFFSSEDLLAKRITKDIAKWNEDQKSSPVPNLLINEIFPTYEGEGRNIGKGRIFVRIQGCSVGCKWCDSKHTWHVKDYEPRSIKSIVKEVKRIREETGIGSVSVTGGEPMQFPDQLHAFLKELKREGFDTNLETSGLFFSPRIFSLCDTISMDIKTPGSGVVLSKKVVKLIIDTSNLLRSRLHIKLVVSGMESIEFADNIINKLHVDTFITLTPEVPDAIHDSEEKFKKHIKEANDTLIRIRKHGILSNKNVNVIVQQHKLMNFE